MIRLSNHIIGILNLVTFLLSIAIIGGGLATRGSADCEMFPQSPLVAVGLLLMAVSIAGMSGTWCRVTWMRWVYMFIMVLLIVLLFCFIIFALVVTNKGEGKAVSGRGYKEYRLEDYSNWLQTRVQKSRNWKKIKNFIQEAKICKNLYNDSVKDSGDKFYTKNLSPIQSGCCKPPASCRFRYVNATVWDGPAKQSSAWTDTDCNVWSNDQSALCYDCNSCKAGFLANLKRDWLKIAVVDMVVLIFLLAVSFIGCCAFRNNTPLDRSYTYKPGDP